YLRRQVGTDNWKCCPVRPEVPESEEDHAGYPRHEWSQSSSNPRQGQTPRHAAIPSQRSSLRSRPDRRRSFPQEEYDTLKKPHEQDGLTWPALISAEEIIGGDEADQISNASFLSRVGQHPVRCKCASSRRMVPIPAFSLSDTLPDMTSTSIPIPRTRNEHNSLP
ncbi:hypothetical protein BG011_002666, partial [Mortierella polycephala]